MGHDPATTIGRTALAGNGRFSSPVVVDRQLIVDVDDASRKDEDSRIASLPVAERPIGVIELAIRIATVIDEAKGCDRFDQAAGVEFEAIVRAVGRVVDELANDLADQIVLSVATVGEDTAASGRVPDANSCLGGFRAFYSRASWRVGSQWAGHSPS